MKFESISIRSFNNREHSGEKIVHITFDSLDQFKNINIISSYIYGTPFVNEDFNPIMRSDILKVRFTCYDKICFDSLKEKYKLLKSIYYKLKHNKLLDALKNYAILCIENEYELMFSVNHYFTYEGVTTRIDDMNMLYLSDLFNILLSHFEYVNGLNRQIIINTIYVFTNVTHYAASYCRELVRLCKCELFLHQGTNVKIYVPVYVSDEVDKKEIFRKSVNLTPTGEFGYDIVDFCELSFLVYNGLKNKHYIYTGRNNFRDVLNSFLLSYIPTLSLSEPIN